MVPPVPSVNCICLFGPGRHQLRYLRKAPGTEINWLILLVLTGCLMLIGLVRLREVRKQRRKLVKNMSIALGGGPDASVKPDEYR